MKKRAWISLTLIAVLLMAAVPAAARSPVTDFVTVAYVCVLETPVKEWVSADGVLHQRGVILRNEYRSGDDSRVTGSELGVLHQDVNLATGATWIWGLGTVLTSEGTWYTELRAESTSEGLVSHVTGHGGDGLEGFFISWEGKQLFPPFDNAPCETDLAMELTGIIRPGYGPRP